MQPTELVAIMAAIIYSGRRDAEAARPETRQAAFEVAWLMWHLALDEWSDSGTRRMDPQSLEP